MVTEQFFSEGQVVRSSKSHVRATIYGSGNPFVHERLRPTEREWLS